VKSPENQNPESLEALKDEIVRLRTEKEKLASELKNREEMMNNLLAYIENAGKPSKRQTPAG
jgi:Tfp pilus assembly protein PilO